MTDPGLQDAEAMHEVIRNLWPRLALEEHLVHHHQSTVDLEDAEDEDLVEYHRWLDSRLGLW